MSDYSRCSIDLTDGLPKSFHRPSEMYLMSPKLSANSSLSLPELPTVNTFYDFLRICSEGPVPSQCIKSTTLVENEIASDDYTGFRNEQLLIYQMTDRVRGGTTIINKPGH